jgi:excisionase family DNA binding protein
MNPQTIRNWIDAGQLPAIRMGQRWVRIRRETLADVLENGLRIEDDQG